MKVNVENLTNYRILAIGAHPDDIEHGCGGTLIKLAEKGVDTYLCIATFGDAGGNADTRKNEQESAASFLKAKRIFWGNIEDTKISLSKDLIDFLDSIIAEIQPDEIYVNWPEDTHQDHMNLSRATMVAARYTKRVLFYEAYTSRNFDPDFFVDISSVMKHKINLMQCHRSQIEKISPAYIDMVESMQAVGRFRGFQGNVEYAEGFKLLRYLRDI